MPKTEIIKIIPQQQKCSCCGKVKLLAEFSRDKRYSNGRTDTCAQCTKDKQLKSQRKLAAELLQDWSYPEFVFRPTMIVYGKPAAYGAFLPPRLDETVVDNMVQTRDGGWEWNCYNVVKPKEKLTRMQLARRLYHAERLGLLYELTQLF